jgi:hypothetical protein
LLPYLLVVLVNTLLQFRLRDGALTQQPANKALHCVGQGRGCNWLVHRREDEEVFICVPVRVQAQCAMLSVCTTPRLPNDSLPNFTLQMKGMMYKNSNMSMDGAGYAH